MPNITRLEKLLKCFQLKILYSLHFYQEDKPGNVGESRDMAGGGGGGGARWLGHGYERRSVEKEQDEERGGER